MEENKNTSALDAFAKKYLQEIPKENPSVGFTTNVMDVILAEEKQVVYKNTTNLFYTVWFVIAAFIIASIYILFNGKPLEIEIPKIDFGILQNIQIPSFFESFSVSTITVYASFILVLFFVIQGYFMKNYFEKRLQ